jgi:hypothetical protein
MTMDPSTVYQLILIVARKHPTKLILRLIFHDINTLFGNPTKAVVASAMAAEANLIRREISNFLQRIFIPS